jgi:hypothetical protein
MSNKPARCDFCNRRIREGQHLLTVRDPQTAQVIGRYHIRPACQTAAAKYFTGGAAIRATVYHPERCGGDVIRLAGEWLDRLEEERERTGEVKQAEEQAKKHCEQRKRYREHLERERCGTSKASLAAVRRTKELRERRLREIREEEERDRAPTPPAVEALVANALGQQDRVRMGQLYDMAIDEGLRWRDVPPAVRRMGFRVERLPEYLNNEFVFPAKPPLLTVEPLVENPLPLTEPLTEPLIEEPPAADYGDHSPFCDCEHCGHSEPKYARAYAGSGSPMAGVA